MAKFKVGDSSRSLVNVNGHHLSGGTWFSPNDVGSSESELRKTFPHFEWDGEAKKTPVKAPITPPKKKK